MPSHPLRAASVALPVAIFLTAAPASADTGTARGAPTADLLPAVIVALLGALVVAVISGGHRRGRIAVLGRMGGFAERVSGGIPGWASLPLGVVTVSLVTAVFGFYWDVSWHIDRGRDPGPFSNPAHWFIIVGLAGLALAGVIAIVLGDERVGSAKVRLITGWEAPVGGVLLTLCGMIALAGFPLDDVWHRIFGQDVTLWGPTHIEMIGGASLATLAAWVLMIEGRRAMAVAPPPLVRRADVVIGGAFLLGLSTLQGEFDYGVPQFRQVFHPVLIMLAAGIGLVAARVRGGRGAALGAAIFFVVTRATLTILIGPVLGRSTLHFPLYLVEALVVEAVAVWFGTERQVSFAALAGLGIGTIGLAAEWAWSHVWMPLPWHRSLAQEGVPLAFAAAVSGSVIGGLIGRALAPPEHARQPTPRGVGAAAWGGAVLLLAWCLPMTSSPGLRANVELVGVGDHVRVSVQVPNPSAVAHADWFDITAWQGRRHGDGGLVISPLHQTGPGTYATRGTVPTGGTWKTMIRFHKGRELVTLPLYLPADPAIPAPAVTRPPAFTAAFVRDKTVLQREAIGGSVGMQRLAYTVLACLAAMWILSLAWGLRRLEISTRGPPTSRPADAVRRPRGRRPQLQ